MYRFNILICKYIVIIIIMFRVYSINIEKIEQMKQTSTKIIVTTHKDYYKENCSLKKNKINKIHNV